MIILKSRNDTLKLKIEFKNKPLKQITAPAISFTRIYISKRLM